MKKYEFQKDRDVENWMRPFTGSVLMPGLRRELRTDTQLFFDFYWQLLAMGYTEEQVAKHALQARWCASPPLHEDLAMSEAVFQMAWHNKLKPSSKLPLYLDHDHPRRLIDRFK